MVLLYPKSERLLLSTHSMDIHYIAAKLTDQNFYRSHFGSEWECLRILGVRKTESQKSPWEQHVPSFTVIQRT